MTDRTIGWVFVGMQAVLLLALVVLPHRGDWSTPWWVTGGGVVLIAAGIVVGVVASLRLGASLTPTPVPNDGGLVTGGLYGWVRHPIYSGVLLIVVGLTVRSGSLVTLAVGALTIGFFHVKAAWEERRLRLRYPDYADYQARTGRFVPPIGSARR